MEQTELKLVDKESCCGGKACDAETQAMFNAEQVEKEGIMAEQIAASQPKTEVTKEMLIANVLELSMTVNRLTTEIGAMAKGVQGMVAEMYQAMIGEIEAIKKAINPQ